jgi:hypothetical protein
MTVSRLTAIISLAAKYVAAGDPRFDEYCKSVEGPASYCKHTDNVDVSVVISGVIFLLRSVLVIKTSLVAPKDSRK